MRSLHVFARWMRLLEPETYPACHVHREIVDEPVLTLDQDGRIVVHVWEHCRRCGWQEWKS